MDKEFPTWEDVASKIDSMLTEIPYKDNAMYGARVTYDILYGMFNDFVKNESRDGKNRQFKTNHKIKA